jgi:hypothetical protein
VSCGGGFGSASLVAVRIVGALGALVGGGVRCGSGFGSASLVVARIVGALGVLVGGGVRCGGGFGSAPLVVAGRVRLAPGAVPGPGWFGAARRGSHPRRSWEAA